MDYLGSRLTPINTMLQVSVAIMVFNKQSTVCNLRFFPDPRLQSDLVGPQIRRGNQRHNGDSGCFDSCDVDAEARGLMADGQSVDFSPQCKR